MAEEVEIGTNVKLNALYIADLRDQIQFLRWTQRTIQSILNRDYDERRHLGAPKEKRLEMMDVIEFENTLQERVQNLKLKLNDCNSLRTSDILVRSTASVNQLLLKNGKAVVYEDFCEVSEFANDKWVTNFGC